MVCELFTWDHQCDIPHWLGLVIEIIIAAVLGGLFFYYEKKRSKRQHEIFTNRHNHAYYSIRDSLEGILMEIGTIEEINQQYRQRESLELEEQYYDSMNRLQQEKYTLENICNTSRDVLEPRHESRVTREIKFISTIIEFAGNNRDYYQVLELAKNTASNMIKDLPKVDDDGINIE